MIQIVEVVNEEDEGRVVAENQSWEYLLRILISEINEGAVDTKNKFLKTVYKAEE